MRIAALSQKMDELYTKVWQNSFFFKYPDLFFSDSDNWKNETWYQDLLIEIEKHDQWKQGKRDDKPPMPEILLQYHRQKEAKHRVWVAELGHEPTSLDILKKYQHLWEHQGDDSYQDEPSRGSNKGGDKEGA